MKYKQDPNDDTKMVPDVVALDNTEKIQLDSWEPIYHGTENAIDGDTYPECRSVWVGRGGDIDFTMASGDAV